MAQDTRSQAEFRDKPGECRCSHGALSPCFPERRPDRAGRLHCARTYEIAESFLAFDYGAFSAGFGTTVACQLTTCHLPFRFKNVPELR